MQLDVEESTPASDMIYLFHSRIARTGHRIGADLPIGKASFTNISIFMFLPSDPWADTPQFHDPSLAINNWHNYYRPLDFWSSEFWSSDFWSSPGQTESESYEPTAHKHRCA